MSFALQPWFLWALAAAVFAALTAIFAKIGVDQIDSNLATLLRVLILLPVLFAVVSLTNAWRPLGDIGQRTWIALALSGIATGASWLCYFRALKLGEAARVASIDKLSVVFVAVFAAAFLAESLSWKNWLGVALVGAGAILISLRA
jgi:transporter family protein